MQISDIKHKKNRIRKNKFSIEKKTNNLLIFRHINLISYIKNSLLLSKTGFDQTKNRILP